MGGLKASLSMALWKPHVAGVHWQSGGPSAPQAGNPVWGGTAALEWVSVPVAKAKAELGSDPSWGSPTPCHLSVLTALSLPKGSGSAFD